MLNPFAAPVPDAVLDALETLAESGGVNFTRRSAVARAADRAGLYDAAIWLTSADGIRDYMNAIRMLDERRRDGARN